MITSWKSYMAYGLNEQGVPVIQGPQWSDHGFRYANPDATDDEINTHANEQMGERVAKPTGWSFLQDNIHSYPTNYIFQLTSGDNPVVPQTGYDHQLILSGDWIALDKTEYPYNRVAGYTFKRKPGVPGNLINSFTVGPADRRPDMIEHHNRLHSADARLDVSVDHLHETLVGTLRLIRDDLVAQKGLIREDPSDTDTVNAVARVAQSIHNIDQMLAGFQTKANQHFHHAANVRVTNALIHGHNVGFPVVHVSDYVRLARRIVSHLPMEATATSKGQLDNIVANLMGDHGRTGFDRLIPMDEVAINSMNTEALFNILIKTPPQYGSAPTL